MPDRRAGSPIAVYAGVYNAESQKQCRKRFNYIVKTIGFDHLFILYLCCTVYSVSQRRVWLVFLNFVWLHPGWIATPTQNNLLNHLAFTLPLPWATFLVHQNVIKILSFSIIKPGFIPGSDPPKKSPQVWKQYKFIWTKINAINRTKLSTKEKYKNVCFLASLRLLHWIKNIVNNSIYFHWF